MLLRDSFPSLKKSPTQAHTAADIAKHNLNKYYTRKGTDIL
nr:MAG TPA: hypothetical protein [Caudoviricetes sp.]